LRNFKEALETDIVTFENFVNAKIEVLRRMQNG